MVLRHVALIGIAVAAVAGCGDKECDGIGVVVNVEDTSGEPVTNLEVSMDEAECANNDDGSFTCPSVDEPGPINIFVFGAPVWMSVTLNTEVEEPEDCETPHRETIVVQVERGGL